MRGKCENTISVFKNAVKLPVWLGLVSQWSTLFQIPLLFWMIKLLSTPCHIYFVNLY